MNPMLVPQWVGWLVILAGALTIWWACGRPLFRVSKKTLKLEQWRIPLIDLHQLAEDDGWIFFEADGVGLMMFVDELRQAGVDKDIEFWGRHTSTIDDDFEPLVNICAKYWVEYEIDVYSCLDRTRPAGHEKQFTKDNSQIRSCFRNGDSPVKYTDLHVDNNQAKQWLKSRDK